MFSENVPRKHGVHELAALLLKYPEKHGRHVDVFPPLYFPASHSEHVAEPEAVVYVPAGQTGHSISRFAAEMALPGVQYVHALPVSM